MQGAVGGDAVEGGALDGGEGLSAAVVGDDLGGEDAPVLVEPGGERADGLSPFVEEPQVRVVAAAALEPPWLRSAASVTRWSRLPSR